MRVLDKAPCCLLLQLQDIPPVAMAAAEREPSCECSGTAVASQDLQHSVAVDQLEENTDGMTAL